jgi:hypothetical protein
LAAFRAKRAVLPIIYPGNVIITGRAFNRGSHD